MKLFGLYVTRAKTQREESARREAELLRLREIEKKYIRLTDRDERGRFKK